MSHRNLAGRVVVLTGAAHGIGAATARLLDRRGARLVVADVDEAALKQLRASLSPEATAVPVDVRDLASVRQLADRASRCGAIAAVVNCAGIVRPGTVDVCPNADIGAQLDTNLGGTINVARAFLPLLRQQRSGHLVFIGSLAGMVPLPGESIYAASKFAVRGFALSLGLELAGSGIAVSVVCPDSTRTRMIDIEARITDHHLSFSSPPMATDVVAAAIARTLERPRLEVTVPTARGWLIRLLGANPWIFPLLHPLLNALGRRNKARYTTGQAATDWGRA